MKRRAFIFTGITALIVSACSKFISYNGPKVTLISANKTTRKLRLFHNDELLKEYDFKLGFEPTGHKEIEVDGRTPEGPYFIDRKNPNSKFYLSIGISYPNADDIAHAKALGKPPGGDIFIHGTPKKFRRTKKDWTWGCLAVKDREMREIYAMVDVGTVILITP